jgi:hypothetical protein
MAQRFRLTPEGKPKLIENHVERQCLDILRLRGFCPIRLNSGKFQTMDGRWITIGERGLPDYVVPLFFVETKAPGKGVTPEQENKIRELKACWGLETAVVDSVASLIEWLDKRAKR